jgi:hypothetical protein
LSAVCIGLGLTLTSWQWNTDDDETEVLIPWQMAQELQRAEGIAARRAALEEVFRNKRQVLEDITAGRMSLLEAAARFRVINRWRSPFMAELVRSHYEDCSEEEQLCREVIASLGALHEGDRCHLAAVRTRLEAELGERRRGNTLRLQAVR